MEEEDLVMLVGFPEIDEEPVLIDPADLFGFVVFTDEHKTMFVLKNVKGSWQWCSFDEEQCRFRRGRACLPVGETGLTTDIQVCVFSKPRCGQARAFWSTSDIHTYINVKTYGGCKSL